MLIGPILAFCLIDSSLYSFLMFIPIGILISLFVLNFLAYYLSPFVVDDESFYKLNFGKKRMNIKKEEITKVSVIYNGPDTRNSVAMIVILYNRDNKLFQTQLSGNLYNFKKLAEAFKKYNYPVEEQ